MKRLALTNRLAVTLVMGYALPVARIMTETRHQVTARFTCGECNTLH